MRPCLAVHQDRKPHTPTDLRDRLAAQMHVSDEDRAVMLPSGRQPLFSNRVAWAVTHLAQAGLLDRPARGVTQITDRGSEVLKRYPDRVDMKVLRQFPEYEEFRTRTKQRKGQSPGTAKDNGISREDLSPREAIEDVIDSAHSAVAADLLARVLKQSPVFLEQLVLRLLVKMGYGGLETPAEHWAPQAMRAWMGSSAWTLWDLMSFTSRPSATPIAMLAARIFKPSSGHSTAPRPPAECSLPRLVSAPMPATTPNVSTRGLSSLTVPNSRLS